MLAWLDLETTGLDIDRVEVLEIAVVLTDNDLNELGHFREVVQPFQEPLFEAGAYEMHKKNGLLNDLALALNHPDTIDRMLSQFLAAHIDSKVPIGTHYPSPKPCRNSVLPQVAGSTVGFDRVLVRKFFPCSYKWFHYRTVDVSTVKELVKRWKPELYRKYADSVGKNKAHRALDDIRQSIAELKIYRDGLFLTPAAADGTK